MNNNVEVYLSNRFIFNINGEDGFEFLQSLVTAEIKPLYEKKAVASCLLTPQGRILFDFIIYPSENISNNFSVFVDCDEIEKDELIKRMSLRASNKLCLQSIIFLAFWASLIHSPAFLSKFFQNVTPMC